MSATRSARSPARLVGASATYAVAGTVGKIASLLTVPVITRSLTPADYGLVDLSTALIALAATIGGLSAELPAARLAAAEPETRRGIYGTYLITSTVIGVAMGFGILVASSAIASSIWQREDATAIAALAGIGVPLTAMQWASWNVHRIQDRPRTYASLSTADLLVKATLMTAAALATSSPLAVVAVYVGATGVGAGVGAWSVRAWIHRPEPSLVGALVTGGVPFTVLAVSSVASTYAVRSVVATQSLPAVGELAVALRIASVIALPLAAFQLAWAPASLSSTELHEATSTFGRSVRAVLGIGGASAIALAAFGVEVVAIAAGAEYSSAAESLPGLSMSVVLGTAFFMVGVANAARRRSLRWLSWIAIAGALAYVALTAAALTLFEPNVAVSVGAIASSAAAFLVLLSVSGESLTDRTAIALLVGALSVGAGLVQVMLATGADGARLGVGSIASIAAIVLFWRWSRSGGHEGDD